VRVLLGSDQRCQSRVQTRTLDAGPLPLVGLADVRIPVLWIGSGHVNPKLLMKRHGKIGHMVLHKLLDQRQEGPAHASEQTWSSSCKACVYPDLDGSSALQAFSQSDAVKKPIQSSATWHVPSEHYQSRPVGDEPK
jgi:hypothetical protein